MSSLYMNAGFLKAEIAKLISDNPDLAEDELLRLDVLEGQTDIMKVIGKALEEAQTAKAFASGLKDYEADIHARRGRFERKEAAMKSLIRSIMLSADLDKLMFTGATLSISKPRASVNVLNVDELPQGFYRLKKEADKTALKKALEAGEKVPGAELSLGEETLTIRVK